ncbi:MAG: hypothetical protein IJ693_07085 [Bacteroidaceae bacterium]|nr:hypothetical protein [Bacteroidaceae bacterium]
MKKLYLTIFISIFAFSVSFAQKHQKSVTIFGDSYSTFEGYIMPENNITWYFLDRQQKDNDVIAVDQTWWYQLLKKNGWKLCMNNSYSGSTISSSGYGKQDYTDRSFVTRSTNLGNPDIIFIFGATNDSWVPSPIGEYKYSGWTTEDLKSFRPSLAKMLDFMKKRYLGVEMYFILNSELSDAINSSVFTICDYYKVPVIVLRDIDKKAGHPSVAGMKAIAEQVNAFVHQGKGKSQKREAQKPNNKSPKKANQKK